MSHDVPEESEIKVLVSERDVSALRARLGRPVRRLHQVSYFYETPQDDLARAGVSLRVREESDESDAASARVTLTAKEAGVRAGALMVRPEFESRLDAGAWAEIRSGRRSFAELDLPPIRRLKELLGDLARLDLQPLGQIVNEREVYDFDAEGMRLELLLDHTTYPDGASEYELETELAQAAAGKGARALRNLFAELAIEWCPASEGKYVRFRRRIGRYPTRPG